MNLQAEGSAKTELEVGAQGARPEIRWIARKLRPVILLYVLLVFIAFMGLSAFVFHSATAVKSLALAALGGVVALLPQVLGKSEYQATETGVYKRPYRKEGAGSFAEVFRWKDLSHVVRTRHGFRYYRTLAERSPVRRFLKIQFSDRYSGEIHVESEDQGRVSAVFSERSAG